MVWVLPAPQKHAKYSTVGLLEVVWAIVYILLRSRYLVFGYLDPEGEDSVSGGARGLVVPPKDWVLSGGL